jgi:SAM-dependent methyltransferase
MTPERPWYRRWFGEEYLSLYPHRDREEAREAVRLFRRLCNPPTGARVLDLACGAGRHLAPLRDGGHWPVGLDLSMPLLRRARADGASRLVRGDMRTLPFASGAFDAVVQFFTSFGYFEDPAEDRRVLGEVRRVLAGGGGFLLDFLNAEQVRSTLVPRDEAEREGRTVRQRRWIEDGEVRKRIEIEASGGEETRVFHERVRLYEPDELEEMMAAAGLRVTARRGDYSGADFRAGSPRLLLAGEAA